ncbi:RNA-binding protein [Candidatus Jorgensenbacteria bacterium RIFCSPLOWO2_02_FULL_45_12]|uniref:RNA-binding protein n=1 Tax=Candidatus Jorgensenbacteria bacterium RIFCSPHIGHO2_02_FULL_45_20 TaxID=1798470 RepID=A0A1F6BQC3_9BACT|nr:MAG: RNA-binding protein [Candidatus Jorgensenbacteria bacterium RIFCSPHIGHO2_02_FULL_45_20]OGG42275.1 MAG: RNA-binding protein [Candidatus Jorgensenbacteria bacterium RIFCSPLOWO2_02_FULL_45_12]
MSKRLYIGGLPYKTTDEELKEAFLKAGEVVSISIMMDKFTGRSRGFGFVEMADDEGAEKAIDMWNGKEFAGRTLVVNEAKPLGERPPHQSTGQFRR